MCRKSFYQFMTKLLLIIMIFQGWPLVQLSHAYNLHSGGCSRDVPAENLTVFGSTALFANVSAQAPKGNPCSEMHNFQRNRDASRGLNSDADHVSLPRGRGLGETYYFAVTSANTSDCERRDAVTVQTTPLADSDGPELTDIRMG